MHFFLSGEIQADVYEDFVKIRREIEQLLKTLEVNDYGSEVKEIGIIPILMNQSGESSECMRKERKLLKKDGEADYRLFIDYERFSSEDYTTKRLLVINNLLECIRQLGKKAKKDFNAVKLEKDILQVLTVTTDELDNF